MDLTLELLSACLAASVSLLLHGPSVRRLPRVSCSSSSGDGDDDGGGDSHTHNHEELR